MSNGAPFFTLHRRNSTSSDEQGDSEELGSVVGSTAQRRLGLVVDTYASPFHLSSRSTPVDVVYNPFSGRSSGLICGVDVSVDPPRESLDVI